MVQQRAAAACVAFATQLFQAWRLPEAVAPQSSSRFRSYPVLSPIVNNKLSIRSVGTTKAYISHHPWRLVSRSQQNKQPNFWYSSSTRLFGTKSGSGIPGKITIEDDQKVLPNIDQDRLRATVNEIRKHIANDINGKSKDRYSTYDVSIFLIDDEAMRDANKESRNINEPTDILSFQFHDAKEPGVLVDPLVDIPDYYNLGDILIDVPYVIRCCEDDQRVAESSHMTPNAPSSDVAENDAGEDEEEEWVDDDRGVSGAMSKVFDPEQRINMLLVHGLLHLVGYDHEDDSDYELMVTKEDEILQKLEDSGLLVKDHVR